MDIQGVANGTLDITMNKNNLEPLIALTVDNIIVNKHANSIQRCAIFRLNSFLI